MHRVPKCSNERAFNRVALLAIIAVLIALASVFLPALAKPKYRASRTNCMNNLKQVGLAFRLWSQDNLDKYPMSVSTNKLGTLEWAEDGNVVRYFDAISNELCTPRLLACPRDKRAEAYYFTNLSNENISYFVGLDADPSKPQMFLAGDRNITNGLSPKHTVLSLPPDRPAGWTETMHVGMGNIGLADGSVQAFTTTELRSALKQTGETANRIALPE